MNTQATSPHVTLVFDGTCGFCTRLVRYLHTVDRHQRVTAKPCQIVQHDPRYGLEEVDCSAMVWAIADDGRRAGGAQACTLVASVVLNRQWPVTVGQLPVIRQALDIGYRIVARNRHRFPGDPPPLAGESCCSGNDPSSRRE